MMEDYSQLNGSGIALKASDQLSVSRDELKFLIGLKDRMYLIQAFNQILTPDAYGDYSGYSVRSVYFDGLDNQDYVERRIKTPFNKRIRLRVYSPQDQTAKFEIKKKWTKNQIKDSVVVTRADAIEMLNGNFEVLKNYDSPTAELGYEICTTSGYRPVSMVEYKRRAYTHPQFSTRITLDSDLRYSDTNLDLFTDVLCESSDEFKFRLIPYRALGKQDGMLLGFKPDMVSLDYTRVKDLVIGIHNESFSNDNEYNALLHPDIIR